METLNKNQKKYLRKVKSYSGLKIVYAAPLISRSITVRTSYEGASRDWAGDSISESMWASTGIYFYRGHWEPRLVRKVEKEIETSYENHESDLQSLKKRGERYRNLAQKLSVQWGIELVSLENEDEATKYYHGLRERLAEHKRGSRRQYRGWKYSRFRRRW